MALLFVGILATNEIIIGTIGLQHLALKATEIYVVMI